MSVTSAVAGPLPTGIIPDNLGVNIHFTSPKPGEMEQIAAAGFTWLRMDLHWAATEKTAGIYDFSAYDELLNSAEANHLRLLLILDLTNKLYDDNLAPHTDAGRAAFGSWAAAAVKHFAGHRILWELFNEPNGQTFWRPKPNPADYAAVCRVAASKIRMVAPDEVLIGPALSTIDLPFLQAAFDGGVLEDFSAVTIHPYRKDTPETVVGDYQRVRRMIALAAPVGKQIPLYSGEWGFAVGGEIDEHKQAQLLAREYLTNLSCGINLSIWYDWHDDGINPKDPEQNFGTVHHEVKKDSPTPYEPKPAYIAAHTLIDQLRGYQFAARIPLSDPRDWAVLFRKDKDIRLVAWTTGEPHAVEIPANAGPFSQTTLLGEAAGDLTGDSQGLSVQLANDPVYLTPKQPNESLLLTSAWQQIADPIRVQGPDVAQIQTVVSNPLDHPIKAQSSTGKIFTVQAGESATVVYQAKVSRSPITRPIQIGLGFEGGPQLTQSVDVVVTNPLSIIVRPIGSQDLIVKIENHDSKLVDGTIAASDGAHDLLPTPLPLRVEPQQSIEMKMHSVVLLGDSPSLLFRVMADGGVLANERVQCQTNLTTGLASHAFSLWPIAGQSLTGSTAPEPPPTANGPVMRLDYHLEAGPPKPTTKAATRPKPTNQTLSITPDPKQPQVGEISGSPQTMTMWMYGDNSGNEFLIRLNDATGQTFQTRPQKIDWNGWRAVSVALDDPNVWHYGGAKDGVMHQPMRWNTLLLLESPTHVESSGTIYFASPTMMETEAAQP